jgi:hypothetical protein
MFTQNKKGSFKSMPNYITSAYRPLLNTPIPPSVKLTPAIRQNIQNNPNAGQIALDLFGNSVKYLYRLPVNKQAAIREQAKNGKMYEPFCQMLNLSRAAVAEWRNVHSPGKLTNQQMEYLRKLGALNPQINRRINAMAKIAQNTPNRLTPEQKEFINDMGVPIAIGTPRRPANRPVVTEVYTGPDPINLKEIAQD